MWYIQYHLVFLFLTKYDVQATNTQITLQLLINLEYRVKCEEGGNYVEAARAHKQFGIVRVQEVRRQQKAVQSRHNLEKEDIQSAHDKQFRDFGVAWTNYMEGNYYRAVYVVFVDLCCNAVLLLTFCYIQ